MLRKLTTTIKNSKVKVLLDSDALIALHSVSDAHHLKAKKIFKKYLEMETELLVTSLVLQESATVVSYKFGQKQAVDFLESFSKAGIRQIFVGEKMTAKAWDIFKRQEKKGTSFIDCANVAIYQETGAEEIMSFDKFYQRKGLKISG